MFKKFFLIFIVFIFLINCVSAINSSNWTTANVGYETFKIPPKYADNPYESSFDKYMYDEDIDVFTIRYVNPNIMDLYGYFLERYHSEKVNINHHDAIHFSSYDSHDNVNNSILWFSAGEEFYYITWRGSEITPAIKEIVKSCSKSDYSHDEFYDILNSEYQNYKITDTIESQRFDYPTQSKGFYSYGSNGWSFGRFY